ncbi:unnamed protein product [Paramecium sonneborni]|uniref:Uncharacterized protein n=1 Tax=Paramecium sonneborni TaxID=65129 RepID=A0A8S1QY50_9CILI|nr:unnamed protein product [Paramecium sonneborni]
MSSIITYSKNDLTNNNITNERINALKNSFNINIVEQEKINTNLILERFKDVVQSKIFFFDSF